MTAVTWKPDPTGVRYDSSYVGSDAQKSDAYCVRYNADHPVTVQGWGDEPVYPVVTIYWYVIEHDDAYAIERQTEYVVCKDPEDPGGTELWGGERSREGWQSHPAIESALTEAKYRANAHTGSDVDWDGQPWQ